MKTTLAITILTVAAFAAIVFTLFGRAFVVSYDGGAPAAVPTAPEPTEPALCTVAAQAPPPPAPVPVAKHAPRPARKSTTSAPAQPATTTVASEQEVDLIDPVEVGRFALALVGSDPQAEELWLAVINDPSVDPEDRKNLIEDLNEDGFADPEHPVEAELPLIEARLALIERLSPQAIDDVNKEAFAEAKKDLTEMRAKLRPQTVSPTAASVPPTSEGSR